MFLIKQRKIIYKFRTKYINIKYLFAFVNFIYLEITIDRFAYKCLFKNKQLSLDKYLECVYKIYRVSFIQKLNINTYFQFF